MQKTLSIILILFCTTVLAAQVYPGDANRSGRVDQQDMLYIGYAYGSTGPARIQTGTAFMEMPITLDWQEAFPNGTGYVYADANGDGQVNITDMLTVVANYGREHASPTEPFYPPAVPGIDPTLSFIPDMITSPLTAGSALTVAISLDYPGLAADDINGLAFSIDFNKNYIQSISLGFSPDWLGGTASSFRFQNIDPQQIGQLDIATTRYGINGAPAMGEVGILSLVIEDDLITFMEEDSTLILVELSKIMLVDESLGLKAVNNDSILLTVYNPNYLLSRQKEENRQQFRCFPNPTQGRQLQLASSHQMEEVRIYDLLGREAFRQRSPGTRTWTVHLPEEWPTGYYLLRAYSKGGRINEQLLLIQ